MKDTCLAIVTTELSDPCRIEALLPHLSSWAWTFGHHPVSKYGTWLGLFILVVYWFQHCPLLNSGTGWRTVWTMLDWKKDAVINAVLGVGEGGGRKCQQQKQKSVVFFTYPWILLSDFNTDTLTPIYRRKQTDIGSGTEAVWQAWPGTQHFYFVILSCSFVYVGAWIHKSCDSFSKRLKSEFGWSAYFWSFFSKCLVTG